MYYFFLYPFVHISVNQGVFLYNTLNNQYIEDQNYEVIELVKKILDSESKCVRIGRNYCNKEFIKTFIEKIRNLYAGDLIEATQEKNPPMQLIEDLKVHKNNIAVNKEDIGIDILDYLNKCLIYINSDCNINCTNCDKMYKQFTFCKRNKNNNYIKFNILKDIINTLLVIDVQEIYISGGDLFAYPFIDELITYIKENRKDITFIINQKHITKYTETVIKEKMTGLSIKLLIDDLDFFIYNNSYIQLLLEKLNVSYQFTIESEKEICKLEIIAENIPEDAIEIVPFFNKNLYFFKNLVYITKEALFEENHSLNSILTNKVINSNFFGSLIIDSDLKVYSSFNKPWLGEIGKNSFQELIYKEISNILTWKLTREHLPVCKNCNYCFLCPAPSNYEIALNKSNLCHVDINKSINTITLIRKFKF